jgi:hypothetical protein
MSHSSPPLTPELQGRIVAFVRAGGFPHVAAEAAGVPQHVFERWLKRGGRGKVRQPYRDFADAVREAAAQARLKAEVGVFDKRPLDWLKCGPGKETPRRPGWSAAPRAQPAAPRDAGEVLALRAVQELFGDLLKSLEAEPEVRAKAAGLADNFVRSRRRRSPGRGI